MKRLADQALVMEAILVVKGEMVKNQHESWMVQGEIMVRLATLYALLDIPRLKEIVEQMDDRETRSNNKEAA